ncbi:probable 2-oxoglutarate dehydrogenase E1 component DHKTD1, mitochondrial [Ischnura elegans]|uniref:probable 2-oxoglutarate dehydrogenase E1 component DHKTD1, mitochondrial n=1 Tax=Ischnura elegans TaxID=197161 RepID=UPI001ED8AADB|nr:probable 2-oxoglutarate dehydrogenase E1 component DHKTD1, mitochondrial [Ischnura elegans]
MNRCWRSNNRAAVNGLQQLMNVLRPIPWITGISYKSSKCYSCHHRINTSKLIKRRYHSEHGVYGYKPKPATEYQVPKDALEARIAQSNFYRLVTAYRDHAHRKANINPISIRKPRQVPELDVTRYGLRENELCNFSGILYGFKQEGTVGEAVEFLEKVYAGNISSEFNYLQDEEAREWFTERIEREVSGETISIEDRRVIAGDLLRCEAFDHFLASKFVTVKRYGGEGAESMMGFFSETFKLAAKDGVEQIIFCMPHRGRLNLLTGMLKFPPEALFRKLKGHSEFPEGAKGSGDVISHLTSSVDLNFDGRFLHVTMLTCPSHLESVNPVSMGKTRARQQLLKDGAYSNDPKARWSDKVLNVQVHGDAAFAGQGVNQETLALSGVPNFEVGGSVHLIVNNQLGFTTPGDRGRSSEYCSDLAKMIGAPVIHVNGDDPELVVKATRVAVDYQRKFRKDVFIDMNCFRRWGHNELDDPTFTNPLVYHIIQSRRSIPDLYAEKMVKEGIMNQDDVSETIQKHTLWLNNCLKSVDNYKPSQHYKKQWKGDVQAPAHVTKWDTGVNPDLLRYVAAKSVEFPEDFNIHPHLLKTHVKSRLEKINKGENVDWATAEAMAFGSLLYQDYGVRISGQDVGRGTFSHRHAMLIDQKTNEIFIPLNNLMPEQKACLEVCNSILSEEAVLAYEYGISITNPNILAIWEAQFGDFFNGAQIQIDTMVSSGETKWLLESGLVMMLPHGYDGAGPEHSSCRLERFLQLSDSSENAPDGEDVNLQIVNPTTPAQYFHLLRRQMIRNYRKPLIIASPKILLRLPAATSSLKEMGPQTTFHSVIGDHVANPETVRRVVFVCGKMYYSLAKQREEMGVKDMAIIRLESLSPFPTHELLQEVTKYRKAKVFIWSQEEHQNMGAWTYVRPRFENLIGCKLRYAGRGPLAAPAVGIGSVHQQEAAKVLEKPFSFN